MMSRSKEIFLGRNGRVHGPFTPSEYEQMTASGSVEQFHWIWDDPSSAWKPLDPAPAPLNRGDAPIMRASAAAVAGLDVLCFDGRSLLAGLLEGATETGCVIVAEGSDGGPVFPGESSVAINLLDTAALRSVSVRARLSSVNFENGRWNYRFRWESSPLEALAGAA